MSELHTLIENPLPDILHDSKFRLALDAHHSFFLQQGNYEVKNVDDHQAQKYRYDLTGYLTSVGVTRERHYVTMRLNGMTSMTEFTYDRFKALIIPTANAISEIFSRYKTTMGSVL